MWVKRAECTWVSEADSPPPHVLTLRGWRGILNQLWVWNSLWSVCKQRASSAHSGCTYKTCTLCCSDGTWVRTDHQQNHCVWCKHNAVILVEVLAPSLPLLRTRKVVSVFRGRNCNVADTVYWWTCSTYSLCLWMLSVFSLHVLSYFLF